MTLSHTRAHVWRALLEGVCFGTRAAVDALRDAGFHYTAEIAMAGGATRSALWLQMHADVTGLPVTVGETDNAPMLGAAVLAAAGLDLHCARSSSSSSKTADMDHSSQQSADTSAATSLLRCQYVERAANRMVRLAKRVVPSPDAYRAYDRVYRIYRKLAVAVAPICHELTRSSAAAAAGCDEEDAHSDEEDAALIETARWSDPRDAGALPSLRSGRKAVVMPSILAADFGYIAEEARRCVEAGARWLHVDVCDGNSGCPGGLSLGPQSVHAIRRACPSLLLDAHIVSDSSMELIEPLVAAGATRITLQLEQFLNLPPANGDEEAAVAMLNEAFSKVRALGAQVGLCIAPITAESTLFRVLDGIQLLQQQSAGGALGSEHSAASALPLPPVDCINVLAVNPGFGGQAFNSSVMEKVRRIHARYPTLPFLQVDGGISNAATAPLAAQAGANVLIAGSGIFGKNRFLESMPPDAACIKKAYSDILSTLMSNGS